MKKNILKVAFVTAIALVSGINVFNAQKSNTLSDVALANVEALADEEIGPGNWIVTLYSLSHWKCDPGGNVSCPGPPW